MAIPTPIHQWLQRQELKAAGSMQPLAGGDINQCYLLTTTAGKKFCLKHHHNPPSNFFPAEARGLKAIRETNTIDTPTVHWVDDAWLMLQYIEPGRKDKTFWQQLGRQLAEMHSQQQPSFGFIENNFCGLTTQINPLNKDGFKFFRQARLDFQTQLAFKRGLLSNSEVIKIEKLGTQLETLIPRQSAALIHGDLWSGNIYAGADSRPYLIDPAAHWGWPEAELAMTLLFGGFNDWFYQSYAEVRPLEPDWRQRAPIYNLYHLLNHLNLFGGGYRSQVMAVVDRFVYAT